MYSDATRDRLFGYDVPTSIHTSGHFVLRFFVLISIWNKTGTSQVGAISKAQKAQNIFFGKKLEIFEKKISFGKCRTVPKNVKGGTLFDL